MSIRAPFIGETQGDSLSYETIWKLKVILLSWMKIKTGLFVERLYDSTIQTTKFSVNIEALSGIFILKIILQAWLWLGKKSLSTFEQPIHYSLTRWKLNKLYTP